MNEIIECKNCGLFIKAKTKRAICPRCSSKIKLFNTHSKDSLYYAISSLLLLILLNIYPLMSLSINGNILKTTLFNTFQTLFDEGFIFVSMLGFFTVIIAPILNSLVIIFAFIQENQKLKIFSNKSLYNGFHFFKAWGFVEVFVVSIIVTYIKLAGMVSSTRFDIGFYIMLFYLFLFYMSNRKFEVKSVFR
jgi:paraquat-inducible protein A